MEAGYFRTAFIGIAGLILMLTVFYYRFSRSLAGGDSDAIVGMFSLSRGDWRFFFRAPFLPVVLLIYFGLLRARLFLNFNINLIFARHR